MKVMRNMRILCLILTLVCIAGCSDSYGDFFKDPDNKGTAQWATPVKTAPSECRFNAVAADKDGNTYAVGYVYGTGIFDFGGNSKAISGKSSLENAVIVKYNSSGIAEWAKSVEESTNNSKFTGVFVDSSGNAYVVGEITGTSNFNFGGKSSCLEVGIDGSVCWVVVKYNSAGIAQWATTMTGGVSKSCGITVDSAGNSYVVGSINGTVPFNFAESVSITIYPTVPHAVIVKYNASGKAQWAKSVFVDETCINEFNSVAVDRSGNAYAVGYVFGSGSYDFGGSITAFYVAGSFNHSVIVKYSSSGEAQWAKPIETVSGTSQFAGVTVDQSGSVYAVGSVSGVGECSFGGNSESFTIPDGNVKSVIVKYDSSGTAQWVTPVRSASATCSFTGVAIDIVGNLYTVGVMDYTGSFDFGGNSAPVNGKYAGENAVIVKYNQSGMAQWATSVTEAGSNSKFTGIAVDRSGYSYAVGYVGKAGTFNFGGQSLPFNGQPNGMSSVIVKYY